MKPWKLLLPLLLLLTLASPAAAEDTKTCSLYPRPKAPQKAGDWVEYRIKGIAVPGTMRMAVTGIEGTGDEKAYWLEISMSDARQGGVVKSLLVGDPLAPKKVTRVIMKTSQMPAMEIPQAMIGKVDLAKNPIAGNQQCSAIAGAPVDTASPDESFTVGGRTIIAKVTRVTRDGKDYVFKHSDKVPLTGLVWADFKSQVVELVGFGHDAKTAITETPVPMDQVMPGLSQMPPPGTPAGQTPAPAPAPAPLPQKGK